MIELERITHETLTLKFNPGGGLANASLCGQNVTAEIRYLEEVDCEDCLEVFGFKSKWEPELAAVFCHLNEALGTHGLSLFHAVWVRGNQYSVYLCDKKDHAFVHKTTRGILLFDTARSKFVQVIRLFELNDAICAELLQKEWESTDLPESTRL